MVSAESPRPALCPAGPRMSRTAEAGEDGGGDGQPSFALEQLKSTNLPVKASPTLPGRDSDRSPCYTDTIKPTSNGVHTIEDRILRITGYYGYYPGYSSHRKPCRRCLDDPHSSGTAVCQSWRGQRSLSAWHLSSQAASDPLQQHHDDASARFRPPDVTVMGGKIQQAALIPAHAALPCVYLRLCNQPVSDNTGRESGLESEPSFPWRSALQAANQTIQLHTSTATQPAGQTQTPQPDKPLRAHSFTVSPEHSAQTTGEEGSESHADTPGSEGSETRSQCQSCTSTALRVLGGLLLVLSVSSSWVGTTQVVKLTFQSFSCPFFMTWFSTNWNILFFPIYYSGHLVTARQKQTPIQKFRECSRIFGEDGLTLKLFLKRTAPFSILWTLTNYLYLLALRKLTATDVSALYCCHKAFVFLLSWIVLKDRFMGVRIVAAIMAITGIVMMAYADGFHGDSIIGVAFAVGSASTSALYKVLFKMFVGSANLGEAAHFFSTLGFFNLIFISCTPVILFFTKVEHWGSLSALPWGYLCGVAGLWLAFNILVNVGVVLTYPILISIGTLLSVPGNAAVDVLKHEVIFSVVRLAATSIICLGFLLLLLPEEWDSVTLRFLATFAEKKGEEHGEELTESSVHTRSRSRANGAVSIPLA
ncbi:S35F4 protein, partial [Atractosteus spatula]|nr:S35F4 protein [Atractosteus spatula]